MHFEYMKHDITIIFLVGLLAGAMLTVETRLAVAQSCLGPAEQQQAINNGDARRFGEIAAIVSRRLNGTVYNGELCRRNGSLVYILTVVKNNGLAMRTVVDAKSGR